MCSFRKTLQQRHAVLPVVHVASVKQALQNAEVAFGAGSDGVFLINHGMQADELLSIYARVRQVFSEEWIGVNCLGRDAIEVFECIPEGINGVWTDNAGIDEELDEQPFARQVTLRRQQKNWIGLYFGGVAFKYQRAVDDLSKATRIAAKHIDVVTTSGPGTGKSASVDKIGKMKSALGDHPLAIASGITPDNVTHYLDYADAFLVASGISTSFINLDPPKVKDLIDIVRAHVHNPLHAGGHSFE